MSPKISVIMPSLNVAPYIRQCMDSVIGQRLRDIEIICVDAGSTDGTLAVLREYEAVDNRIRVIVSDKKSYGYQMNLGLAAARGEYIGIVETDDWIDAEMFQKMWETAVHHDADLVKCNYYLYYTEPEEQNIPSENLVGCPYNIVCCPRDIKQPFMVAASIWSGLYKRSMLEDADVRFNETPGASFQDTSFFFTVCTLAERAVFLNQYYYHYRKDNSASSVNNRAKIYCICDEMQYFEAFLKASPEYYSTVLPIYLAAKYEKYRWNYYRIGAEFQWEFLRSVRNEFLAHCDAGDLIESAFRPSAWKELTFLLDNPIGFFSDTCKTYATRPIGSALPDADLLHSCHLAAPDVTIIIPCWNAEQWISTALSSAVSQTHQNTEVLCIDDGSSDHTLQIIEDFAGRYPQISVFHQLNMGQASARNHGMAVAKGKYLLFLDADDSLREDAVASLLQMAEQNCLDLVYFDGETIFESDDLKTRYPFYIDAYEHDLDFPEAISGLLYFQKTRALRKWRVSPCLMMYRTGFLREHRIRFIDGILHEDNPFSFECAVRAKRVMHIREKYYRRLLREDSTMTQAKSWKHGYGMLTSFLQILTICDEIDCDTATAEQVADELQSQINMLRETCAGIEDQEPFMKKLTPLELFWLNTLTDRRYQDLRYDFDCMQNSVSFRVGRAITWFPRKLRGGIRCFREHGLQYTIRRAMVHIGLRGEDKDP